MLSRAHFNLKVTRLKHFSISAFCNLAPKVLMRQRFAIDNFKILKFSRLGNFEGKIKTKTKTKTK